MKRNLDKHKLTKLSSWSILAAYKGTSRSGNKPRPSQSKAQADEGPCPGVCLCPLAQSLPKQRSRWNSAKGSPRVKCDLPQTGPKGPRRHWALDGRQMTPRKHPARKALRSARGGPPPCLNQMSTASLRQCNYFQDALGMFQANSDGPNGTQGASADAFAQRTNGAEMG